MLASILATDEPNGKHFPADPNEVIWGTLAFIVLMALLYKFAWPVISKAMAGRGDRIEAELTAARDAEAAARARLEERQSQVGDAGAEGERIVAQAHETADQLKVDLRARVETEVQGMHQRADADIEAGRRQAMADLQAEVSRMTLGAAEAVVNGGLDAGTHAGLIDDYISQVGGGS
ncbi:MAG: F0F1 ATP synthase subunit B [Actinomycetia bacterium]|nr:F0F1 ATP synthase subunit B [Actinomycetes bacterium]MCP3910663.1 F0F1 ATP synthase subunit B [Actinomycetes bacterium]MCP4084710.1 F0F1 ATP synthase subunit B [Actinomycetes bacterium]